MTKRIKHLVAIGAASIITLGATVPVSAQTINCKLINNTFKNKIIIKIVNQRPTCIISNPAVPGNPNDNNTVEPEVKPEETPDNTPAVPGKPNDNNTVKPEVKPEVKPDNKPEVKPEETPDNKPETSNNFAVFQQKVLDLVNAERSKVGAKPLKMNTELSKVATTKSQDMINKNYFDHNSPTYGSPFDMMNKFGISYKTAGENIAMGQSTPEEVMKSWMNSSGHRKNILSTSFTEIGIGVAKNSKGQIYWTQMFIGK